MKTELDFQTLKDISDSASYQAFLDILAVHGFTIEKIAPYEPIKNPFDSVLFG